MQRTGPGMAVELAVEIVELVLDRPADGQPNPEVGTPGVRPSSTPALVPPPVETYAAPLRDEAAR